jgi:hypothetical protein
MTQCTTHWHPILTLPCLVWSARICKNTSCIDPSTLLVFDSCEGCANRAVFCGKYTSEWRDSAEKKLKTIRGEHHTGIQRGGSIVWYGKNRKALLDEVEATLQSECALLSSPPTGFFKYHCRYSYTHGCRSWVWVNNGECTICLVSYTLFIPWNPNAQESPF